MIGAVVVWTTCSVVAAKGVVVGTACVVWISAVVDWKLWVVWTRSVVGTAWVVCTIWLVGKACVVCSILVVCTCWVVSAFSLSIWKKKFFFLIKINSFLNDSLGLQRWVQSICRQWSLLRRYNYRSQRKCRRSGNWMNCKAFVQLDFRWFQLLLISHLSHFLVCPSYSD